MNEILPFPELAPAQRMLPAPADPPVLYLGSVYDAQNHFVLEAMRVWHVLSVLEEAEFPLKPPRGTDSPAPPPDVAADRGSPSSSPPGFMYMHPDVTYLRLPAEDSEEERLDRHFNVAHDFVLRALSSGSSVLVHCRGGVSRSATIVVVFLMRYKQWCVSGCVCGWVPLPWARALAWQLWPQAAVRWRCSRQHSVSCAQFHLCAAVCRRAQEPGRRAAARQESAAICVS